MADAISEGLVELINRARGTSFTRQEFLSDCRARASQEEIFQQAYMCNPMGASANHIVEWSAIERCRYDYEIVRAHFEHVQIIKQFGEFRAENASKRQEQIKEFIRKKFCSLFKNPSTGDTQHSSRAFRLGFDVAASGEGDLAAIYIDEAKGEELWLRGLFTCRTEDWDFLQTVLYTFMGELRSVQAAGDSSGLGQQICWGAEKTFGTSFISVNFGGKKHELGFALMNQLAVAQKRFPRSEQDIAADYFALQKRFNGNRWVFSEGRNSSNVVSHCDIAWAGALATHAHTEQNFEGPWAMVLHENGWSDGKNFYPDGSTKPVSAEERLVWSDDPRIWQRWG
jgi:phage FluMu gp28-like protein